MSDKSFKNADLSPVKKLIKEKVSDGELSNQDIACILDETRSLYKSSPLTEIDILKIYNTMIDELSLGVDNNNKIPLFMRIVGIVTAISWAALIPVMIDAFSYLGNFFKESDVALSATNSILIILFIVLLGAVIVLSIISGIFMFLNRRVAAARLLYSAIGVVCANLIVITSLEGVSSSFVFGVVIALIYIAISVYLHPQLAQERRFYRMVKQLDTEIRYKEGRLGMAVNPSKGYIELDFFNLFWIFIIGSIIGLLAEYVFHILFVWGFNPENWYDRAGLLFGPFSPIYGFGALFMTLFLNRLRNINPIIFFCLTTIIGGAFEYFVSWFLEVAFGIEAWNYTGMFLSINGRTCLLFAAMFGVMGFIWIKWALPIFMKIINKIPWKMRYPITFVVAILMIINCIMTLQAIDCWSQRMAGNEPITPIEQFYEKNFDDSYMQKRFASMSFQKEKSSRNNIEAVED